MSEITGSLGGKGQWSEVWDQQSKLGCTESSVVLISLVGFGEGGGPGAGAGLQRLQTSHLVGALSTPCTQTGCWALTARRHLPSLLPGHGTHRSGLHGGY